MLITTVSSLKRLQKDNPRALYDLFQKNVDPNHQFFKDARFDSKKLLIDLVLLKLDGEFHEEVRKFVKNALIKVGDRAVQYQNPLLGKQVAAEEKKDRTSSSK